MPQDQSRIVLPVPGLNVSRPWNVGPVRIHPAGAVAALIEETHRGAQVFSPGWYAELVTNKTAELAGSAVADVTVAEIGEAMPQVQRALAVLRVVQRLQHPMVDPRRQAFGLPGQVTSARVDYLELSAGAGLGWRNVGAGAGGGRWCTAPR
jgi:hypothetical protein